MGTSWTSTGRYLQRRVAAALIGGMLLSGCAGSPATDGARAAVDARAAGVTTPPASPTTADVLAPGVTRVALGRPLHELLFFEGALWATTPSGLVRIDPASGEVTDEVTFGGTPGFFTAGAGALWVTDFDGALLYRVDAVTAELGAPIAVKQHSEGVSFADGHLWVSNHRDSSVQRIDPATGAVVADIEVETGAKYGGPAASSVGFGSVWVSVPSLRSVVRIDVATGGVVAQVELNDGGCSGCGTSVVTGEGTPSEEDDAVWVLGDTGVSRVDARTNEATGFLELGRVEDTTWDGGLAVTEHGLWASTGRDSLALIDPVTAEIVQEVAIAPPRDRFASAYAVTFGAGTLWVWDAGNRTLVQVDPDVATS